MDDADPKPEKPPTGRPKGATNASKAEIIRYAAALIGMYTRQQVRDRLRRKFGLTSARANKYVNDAYNRAMDKAIEEPAKLFNEQMQELREIYRDERKRPADRIAAIKQAQKMTPRKGKDAAGSHRGRVEQLMRDNPELLADMREWSVSQLTVVEPNEGSG